MTSHDLIIMAVIGGIFIILGIIGLLWGRREENDYYTNVSTKIDVREFLDHVPWHPEPGAIRTGGKICFAVGIVLLLIVLGFYLWGMKP
jgi:hypothetical protein